MSRIMFRFWLDDTKDDQNSLIGQIEDLKSARSFTETIRQGIELITDLRKGSLRKLFELFPYVKAEFLEYVQSLNLAEQTMLFEKGTPGSDKRVREQLARIEKLLLEQGHISIEATSTQQSKQGRGLQPITTTSFAPPNFDDDDDVTLTIKKATSSNGKAGENFLKSIMSLQD
ncbi:hypothetical protein KC921_05180 [Candidatus Woesebacteria bacterium]|nr:hypothetical protein [Candidatus Woesebacteria bacterium]